MKFSGSKRILCGMCLLAVPGLSLSAAEFTLERIEDLNATGAGSHPGQFVQASGMRRFFVADDGVHGEELWISDGSEAGTRMVRDILPGHRGSHPSGLTVVNTGVTEVVVFSASDDTHGTELWQSDGTESGTVMIADIRPGEDGSRPRFLTAVGNKVAFRANDGTHGLEPWISDGTDGGTAMVRDIHPGADSGLEGGGGYPKFFIAVGGVLYFNADDGIDGRELWKSDGTEPGTVMVHDINPGAGSSSPRDLTESGGEIFFKADDGTNGTELWKTDGTSAGTTLVQDINPGSDPGVAGGVGTTSFLGSGGTLFFQADDGTNGTELWVSDGTAAGTAMVQDINPGGPSDPDRLVNVAPGLVLFTADDGTHGEEPWISEGTEPTTDLLKDINPGGDSDMRNAVLFSSFVLFGADDGTAGEELWISNATPEHLGGTTSLIRDIRPGTADGLRATTLANLGNTAYFAAHDGQTGVEPWTSDASESGTTRLVDINTATDHAHHAHPPDFALLDGVAYFSADDGIHGEELWAFDGETLRLVADINPDFRNSRLRNLTVFNGELFFHADDGTHGGELWKSDGTTAGTGMVQDIRPGPDDGRPGELTVFDGALFFAASNGTDGRELWKTDGTAAGTAMVKNINTDPSATGGNRGAFPSELVVFNGALFFAARDAMHADELWQSDGTESGTVLVKDIDPGGSGGPRHLTVVGDTLYFQAEDGLHGEELWKSDGTEAGTEQVADINPDAADAEPSGLFYSTALDILLFSASDGSTGRELWRSDGTGAGTVRVADILPGPDDGTPLGMTDFGDAVIFAAFDPAAGFELHRYDGDRVTLVRDLNPGPEPGIDTAEGFFSAEDMAAFGDDALLFGGDDGSSGFELWQTDGTAGGTTRLADLNPGAAGSHFRPRLALDGELLFVADDGETGRELWRAEIVPSSSGGGGGAPAGPMLLILLIAAAIRAAVMPARGCPRRRLVDNINGLRAILMVDFVNQAGESCTGTSTPTWPIPSMDSSARSIAPTASASTSAVST